MRPIKRLSMAVKASGVVTAVAVAVFAAPAAHAASSATVVRATKWVGGCEAVLYSNSSAQARSRVYKSQGAPSTEKCTGWLERQATNTSDWETVSGYHTITAPGASAYTGWYDDSYAQRATACVESWNTIYEIETACTAAW
ncbi:hypothetical protein DFJ67_5253 [Asanoa ferruginea]|uniref:Uncharacterized protein n=1 Tax=Asanoa ferruginea TaxID=53367 RepID=A0A3D9ZPP1_9ACTN|nr:hypothetical protein [Asanoa ferruginea]REF99225.1 hypothetical protein DFJ67_5253 [Asanoa ferruginea]GIF45818.1 hypothetical protein Afe04nite_03570 [Asanoa ferruginea]